MAHAVVEQTPGHNHHGRRRDADHRRESGDHYGRMTILIDGRTCAPAGFRCSTRAQVSLVQENIDRMTIPCTSLVDLVDYPPDSGRLEQKTPARYAFWCTSETCTSRHHLEASKRTSTNKLQFIGLFHHQQKSHATPIHSRAQSIMVCNLQVFAIFVFG